jgi:hypothetical protein
MFSVTGPLRPLIFVALRPPATMSMPMAAGYVLPTHEEL